MRRFVAAILLIAVLAVGGGLIANAAYQAGVDTAVVTAVGAGGTVGTPVVVPAYGYGWRLGGPGFGFFGFLVTLFILFIVFGLIRAIFWGGPRRGHGWGGPGRGHGWGGAGHEPGRSPWETKAHDAFDQWHRRAHDDPSDDAAAPASTDHRS